jgi:hypothetical protein
MLKSFRYHQQSDPQKTLVTGNPKLLTYLISSFPANKKSPEINRGF